MRFTVRKFTQVISGLSMVVLLHFVLTVYVRNASHTDQGTNQLVAESDSLRKQSLVNGAHLAGHLTRESDTFDSPRPALNRRISEHRRVERSLEDLPKFFKQQQGIGAETYKTNSNNVKDTGTAVRTKPKIKLLGQSVLKSEALGPTELKDIFISVKTTKKYHAQRLDLLLQTWVVFAQDVVSQFTFVL